MYSITFGDESEPASICLQTPHQSVRKYTKTGVPSVSSSLVAAQTPAAPVRHDGSGGRSIQDWPARSARAASAARIPRLYFFYFFTETFASPKLRASTAPPFR